MNGWLILYGIWFLFCCFLAIRGRMHNFITFLVLAFIVPFSIYIAIPIIVFLSSINYQSAAQNAAPSALCLIVIGFIAFCVFGFTQFLGFIGTFKDEPDLEIAKVFAKQLLDHDNGEPIKDKNGYVIGYKVLVEIKGKLYSAAMMHEYKDGHIIADEVPKESNRNGIYFAYKPDAPILEQYKFDAKQAHDWKYYLGRFRIWGDVVYGEDAGRGEEAQLTRTEPIDPKNWSKQNMPPPKGEPAITLEEKRKKNFWKV